MNSVNIENNNRCICVYENNDDWDEPPTIECQFCINRRINIKPQDTPIQIKKRINYEKRRNRKILKIKLLRLIKETNDKIDKNTSMKKLAFGMQKVFKHPMDWITFAQILVDNKITNLFDFFKIKQLYHYDKIIRFRDDRIKARYPSKYDSEKIQFCWTDNAQYILRVLVGLTRFGSIDAPHIKALYWNRSDEDVNQVKQDIEKVFNNDFIIEQIRPHIMKHLSFYFDSIGINFIESNYQQLGLNLYDVYSKCATTQIEGENFNFF